DISFASNIIFSNGDLDPWRPGGGDCCNSTMYSVNWRRIHFHILLGNCCHIEIVLEDVSATLVALPVKGGAHHLDLRASNPQDPPTVTQAREQELQLIRMFIE
ncbi:unnamed protein product, partial [Porites evermanni]